MNRPSLRPYRSNDYDKLCEILTLNIPKYFAAQELADFKKYLTEEIENYYVAEIDHTLVGCGGINYMHADHVALISWDIIHPAHHGKGIGKRLLNHRIQHIRDNHPLYKIVVRTSQLAYLFYEKQGFKLLGMHSDFWAYGYEMYKMEYNM